MWLKPMMSGIGGYGTILIYDATRNQTRFLNSSGRIPKMLIATLLEPQRPTSKPIAAARKLFLHLSTCKRGLSLPSLGIWIGRKLLEPAIKLADNGFLIDKRLAMFVEQQFAYFSDAAQRIYGLNGKPFKSGDILHQNDLATSLATIAADGVESFYSGKIGRKIIETVQRQQGFLSQDDFAFMPKQNGSTQSRSRIEVITFTRLHRQPHHFQA